MSVHKTKLCNSKHSLEKACLLICKFESLVPEIDVEAFDRSSEQTGIRAVFKKFTSRCYFN